MKYSLGELIWKVTGDSSQFDSTIDRSDNKLKNFAKTAAKTGAAIGVAIAAGLGIAAKKFVDLASDAAETQQKFDVVFAGIGQGANKMANDFAKSYGIARSEAKALLASTGDLLAGFGFSSDATWDLSLKLNKLAADLVSFSNYEGGVKGASAALTSAVLGQTEAVQGLGIKILDEDVKNKVLQLSTQGLTFATERQAKAYATLQLALEQSKNAIGDVERSKASFANQVRFATAAIEDEATALGDALLPYAGLALSAFRELNDTLVDNIDSMSEWTRSAETAAKIAGALNDVIGPLMLLFKIGNQWIGDFSKGLDWANNSISNVGNAAKSGSNGLELFNAMMAAGSIAAVTLGSTISVVINTLADLTSSAILAGKAIVSVMTIGYGKGIAQAKEDLDNFNESLLAVPRNAGQNIANAIDNIFNVTSRVAKNFSNTGQGMLDDITETQNKIKSVIIKSVSEVGDIRDYEAEKEKRRQRDIEAAQKQAEEAKTAEARKEAEKRLKALQKQHEAEAKADRKAAEKSAEVTKQSVEDALKIASDLAHDYGTSQSELTQMQIDDAYQLVKGIQSIQQDAINAAKAGNREAAEAAEESAKRQIESLKDVAAAAKTSAQNRLDYDKEVVDKQKEAQAALDSLTPEGLIYYSLYGSEPPEQLTKDAADAYNEAAKQEQAAKDAIDKLTPGGLITYSLMGEAGYEGTVEQLADQASEIASMLGDMYDRMGDIVNQYYQNQIDSINADRDARKDAIDAETEAKINSLDKSAMSEEDYNNTVDAINNEADAKKAAIERDAAQRSYQIQLAQFKAKQQFDIGETISNTAVAVMKAYSQLGIFGKVMAVVIAGMGSMQVSNIKSQQPPEPPAFANGGIVPAIAGVPTTGDQVTALVTPGELILNEAQQDTISGKLSGNSPINITIITPDKRTLYKGIYDASKRGEVLIDTRAVVK